MRQLKNIIARLKIQIKKLNTINKVIGFIVGLLVVLWIVQISVFRQVDIKIAEAMQQNEKLVEQIRQYYRQRPDYWGLNTKSAIDNKIVPVEMISVNGLHNIWKVEILVGNGENGEFVMPGSRGFDIVYKNLDYRQCVEMVSYKYNEKFLLGLMNLSINNGTNSLSFGWGEGKTLPLEPAKAKKVCEKNNTVLWHYE